MEANDLWRFVDLEEIIREFPDRIAVIGLGGAGGRVVSNLRRAPGVHVVAVDTDAVDLNTTKVDRKILLGYETCRGQGCGGYPERGAEAAQITTEQLREMLQNKGLAFIVTGLGGGTGTGGSPVIAELSRELGTLTLVVAILPLSVEKVKRQKAREGLRQLTESCDAVLVVDNDKLRDVASSVSLERAFAKANEMICTLLENLLETITVPSLVNLDLADLQSTMRRGGVSVIGVGEGIGANRVEEAVRAALNNPLLDVANLKSAYGCLIHLKGGDDLTLEEVNRAEELITEAFPNLKKVSWGTQINEAMKGRVRAVVILTGVESPFLQYFDTWLGRLGFEVRRHLTKPLRGLHQKDKETLVR